MGWRLPSVVELSSVREPFLPAPFVPTNIFSGINGFYWSATTGGDDPTLAWFVDFTFLSATGQTKAGSIHAWCVRGPMNADTY